MSVLSPVVLSIDGANRRIYLRSGVTVFHWVDDIYKEYRHQRATDEALRVWSPLLRADGNIPKGGGKYTPRFVTLLSGTKIVPYDETQTISVTGEGITDDTTDPFYTVGRTHPLRLDIEPPASEVIRVSGGSGLSEAQDATLTAALQAAQSASTEAAKGRKMQTNKAIISGDGRSVSIYEDDGTTLLHSFTVSEDQKIRTPV